MRFSDQADVAVVIPVHNGLDLTLRCLESLRDCTEHEALVVVVDDGSTDGSAEALVSFDPALVILHGDGSLWWSGSVDLGCEYAVRSGATKLLVLNNDNVLVSGNLVSSLVRLLATTRGCVAAVALCDDPHEPRPRIAQAGGGLDWAGRGVFMHRCGDVFEQAYGPQECSWLPGCALMFESDAFSKLGGFDRRFPQYRGDIDFTLRAAAAGLSLHVTDECWVFNDRSQVGLDLTRGVSLVAFVRGFVSLKSNYNLREAIPFALRHCPRRHLFGYLARFYLRNTYAFVKPRLRSAGDLFAPSAAS